MSYCHMTGSDRNAMNEIINIIIPYSTYIDFQKYEYHSTSYYFQYYYYPYFTNKEAEVQEIK